MVKYSQRTVWKSRAAFEKSTFFQRLKLQGFHQSFNPGFNMDGLWDVYLSGDLRQKRSFRINSLRAVDLVDFTSARFRVGSALSRFPNVFEFNLQENAHFARHPFWGAGLAYVQDPVALEIVDDLNVQPHMKVLDLCAAPGGKSIRIAELLRHTGWVVSNDADYKRSRVLSNNLTRHGVLNSTVFGLDGIKLAQSFENTFDRILIDAPCSGESMFFKREERRRDVYESEVQECVAIQSALLKAAASALKDSGILVYSTCTYNLSENEEVVRRFLKNYPDFSLIKEERRWPHLHGTAGGYWAVLQKKGTSSIDQVGIGFRQDCLRHSLSDSKGDPDMFAHAMNRALSTATGSFVESTQAENLLKETMEPLQDWILMDEKYADAYLSGEALSNPERKRGLFCILWKEKWPLGPAKGVESRFNNLLPLESRRRG